MNISQLNQKTLHSTRHTWHAWLQAQPGDADAITLIDALPMRLYEYPWCIAYFDKYMHQALHDLSSDTVVDRIITPALNRAYDHRLSWEAWWTEKERVLDELQPQHEAEWVAWKLKIRDPLKKWLDRNPPTLR